MRILEIRLDGFGHFADLPLTNLSDRLTVVVGPNEAGKSTLLEFIRTVLFGFPTRDRDRHYPPLAGGRHGGRIVVVDDEGRRYVVERYAGPRGGPVTVTALGHSGDIPALEQLRGHASAELFKNVFAFDLEQLFNMETLQKAGVSEHLYSVGMGAAQLPAALRRMEKAAADFFTPRGRDNPTVNATSQLEDVERQLRQIRDDTAEYGALVQDREAVRARLHEIEAARRQVDRELRHAETLRTGWKDWVALQDIQTRLDALPQREALPRDAFTRLEAAEERLQRARRQLRDETEEQARVRDELGALRVDESILAELECVEQLRAKRDAFSKSLQDLPERRQEAEAFAARLSADLRQLGLDWDAARLAAFDTSLPVRAAVEEHDRTLTHHQQQLHDAETMLLNTRARLQEVQADHTVAAEALDTTPPPDLDAGALADRRSILARLREQFGRLEAAEESARREQQQLRELEKQRSQAPPTRDSARVGLPLALGLLAGLLLLGLGVVAGGSAGAVGVAGGIVMALAGAAGSWWLARGSGPRIRWTDLDLRISTQRNRVHDVETAADRVRDDIARLRAAAGDVRIGNRDELEAFARTLDQAEALLRTWNDRQEAVAASRRRLTAPQAALERAQTALATARSNAQEASAVWRAWVRARGLPEEFLPDGVLSLFGKVDALRELEDRLHGSGGAQHRVDAIEQDIAEFVALAAPLAAARGSTGGLVPQQAAAFTDEVIAQFDAAREAARQRAALQDSARAAQRRVEAARAQKVAARRTLDDLFATAAVTSADAFRRAADEQEQRRRLQQEADQHRAGLILLSGPGPALDGFSTELRATTAEDLEARCAQLRGQQQEVGEEQRSLDRHEAEVSQRIVALEQSTRAAELREQRTLLREQLSAAGREWAALTLARAVLERARRRYEEERQPGVVRRAEAYFRHITNGRYAQLTAPVGERQINVIQADGVRKTPEVLSRATREQLYLALRFGLIEEFGRHSVRLPVIMDDILVNFDPERAQRTARALSDLSAAHQVILFTCHPGTVDLFRAAVPDAVVLDLAGGVAENGSSRRHPEP